MPRSAPSAPCIGVLTLALACGAPEAQPPAPTAVPFCESGLQQVYDPDLALHTWPDDHWAVPDETTRTGLRLDIDPGHPAVAHFPDLYDDVIVDMTTMDGFGTTAELYLTFGAALPADLSVLETVLLTGGADGWVAHAHATWASEDGRTLFLRPQRPLPPSSRAVLGVKRALADGSTCLSPAPRLRALLTDAAQPLHGRYAEGLDALGWAPAEVGAMTVFTTQSVGAQSAEVVADIGARDLALDAPMACGGGDGTWRSCAGTVTVGDYRGADGVVPDTRPVAVQQTHALPVQLWLPDDGDAAGPYPVLMCGHGLAGHKGHCTFAARVAAPLGWATLAIDAVEHGEHPARTQDGSALDITMALCGFTLTPASLAPLRMRDGFRQSAWDRLQVLRAVQAGWDVDDDGVDELDGTRLAYTGVSLGGIMGVPLLEMAPELASATLLVAGGGFFDLFLDSTSFGIIGLALAPDDWTDDDLARTVPLLQTMVDAADPLAHAAAVSAARGAGETRPHTALLMAHEDLLVPNRATTRLAQALQLETAGAALVDVEGLPAVPGPVSGNLADGATGAFLQLDRTRDRDTDEWEAADHLTMHRSTHFQAVLTEMLTAEGAPVIEAPYAER